MGDSRPPPRRFTDLKLDHKAFLANYEQKVVKFFLKRPPAYLPRDGWLQSDLVTEKLWPKAVTVGEMVSFLNWAALCVHGKVHKIWQSRRGPKNELCAGISQKWENLRREDVLSKPDDLLEDDFIQHVAAAFSPKDEAWRLRKAACPVWPSSSKASSFAEQCNVAFEAFGVALLCPLRSWRKLMM